MADRPDQNNSILFRILNCPDCGKTMTFTHISPGEPGYHRLTFRCDDCHHTETILVKAHANDDTPDQP